MKSKRVAYFNNSGDLFGDTQSNTDGITKKALVCVEGTFNDSANRPHTFSQSRLESIAEATNAALDKGAVIPVCLDHQKNIINTVGEIEGSAYTKIIETDDLPNKKATHLLGKLGLFMDGVVVKAQEIVDKISSGVAKSVSMGLNLDPNDPRIVELSLVSIPAIENMALMSKYNNTASFAMDWESLDKDKEQLDDKEEEYEDLCDDLWTILNNIYSSADSSMVGSRLNEFIKQALDGFNIRVFKLLNVAMVEGQNDEGDTLPGGTAEDKQELFNNMIAEGAPAVNPNASYGRTAAKLAKFGRLSENVRKIAYRAL